MYYDDPSLSVANSATEAAAQKKRIRQVFLTGKKDFGVVGKKNKHAA